MNRNLLTYGIWLIILPLLQELIFNHMYLFGFINPQVYPLLVAIFPFSKSRHWLLILSFVLGLSIDLLSNEGGIHAAALVFIAFSRPFFYRIVKGEVNFDDNIQPHKEFSLGLLFLWVLLLMVTHHLIIFTLENFELYLYKEIILKTLVTSVLSTLAIVFIIDLFLKNRNS